jgi:hypothetical protein
MRRTDEATVQPAESGVAEVVTPEVSDDDVRGLLWDLTEEQRKRISEYIVAGMRGVRRSSPA